MFLASPEQTGPSSTTYEYRTAAAVTAAPPGGTLRRERRSHARLDRARATAGRRSSRCGRHLGALVASSSGFSSTAFAYASWRFAVTWLKSRKTSSGTEPFEHRHERAQRVDGELRLLQVTAGGVELRVAELGDRRDRREQQVGDLHPPDVLEQLLGR